MLNEFVTLSIRGERPNFEANLLVPCAGMEKWDALEEALYVWYELNPCGRYWRQKLFGSNGECLFAYAGVEFVKVRRIDGTTFELEDVRG